MKVSDDLFQLIKSLDKNERRYFRLFASLQTGSKQYMKLFEAIDAQRSYSEEEIRQRFADEQFVRQLAVAKNYLYNLILKCLGLYHSGNGQALDRMLQHADLLRRRALYRQALKIVTRGEQLAEESGELERLLIFLDVKRGLQLRMMPTVWRRSRPEHEARARRTIALLERRMLTEDPSPEPTPEKVEAGAKLMIPIDDDLIIDRASRYLQGEARGDAHPLAIAGVDGTTRDDHHGISRDGQERDGDGRDGLDHDGIDHDGREREKEGAHGTASPLWSGMPGEEEVPRQEYLEAIRRGDRTRALKARGLLALHAATTEAVKAGLRVDAEATLRVGDLLRDLLEDSVFCATDGHADGKADDTADFIERCGARLAVRDLLHLQLMHGLRELGRGHVPEALETLARLARHADCAAFPAVACSVTTLQPLLHAMLEEPRRAERLLGAATRAAGRNDEIGRLMAPIADALSAAVAAAGTDAWKTAITRLKSTIPPLPELPGLSEVLVVVLDRLARP